MRLILIVNMCYSCPQRNRKGVDGLATSELSVVGDFKNNRADVAPPLERKLIASVLYSDGVEPVG